ncbi:MAG: DUF1127 domain-containing protein [Alphaproteobacteria bacterium]|nr:DUF1127 domain-containing protein [Alphaproteobacteria bacterium]MBT7943337.1 DUF1127 domain-containing protein [Alphaproteobacteria bacterium]
MYQSEAFFPSNLTWRIWLRAGVTLAKGQAQQAVAMVNLWRNRSSQRRALVDMSDHMLRDIGIDRLDALRESEKPFWRR